MCWKCASRRDRDIFLNFYDAPRLSLSFVSFYRFDSLVTKSEANLQYRKITVVGCTSLAVYFEFLLFSFRGKAIPKAERRCSLTFSF